MLRDEIKQNTEDGLNRKVKPATPTNDKVAVVLLLVGFVLVFVGGNGAIGVGFLLVWASLIVLIKGKKVVRRIGWSLVASFVIAGATISLRGGDDGAAATSNHQTPPATPAVMPKAPSQPPNPSVPDCPGLLEDADFLAQKYERVRQRSYRASTRNCAKLTEEIHQRFPENWHAQRRVRAIAQQGEPASMDAARTLGVGGVAIVLSFACDGPRKLRRTYGREVVDAYDRDFKAFERKLRQTCGDPSVPNEYQERVAARRNFDDKRGNNAEAAATAEGLLKLLGKNRRKLDVYVKLKGAETGFKMGIPITAYRRSVQDCNIMVVTNPLAWTATKPATKNDLIAQFVNTLHTLYPDCHPYVLVNNGVRDVATGSWSAFDNGPKVALN